MPITLKSPYSGRPVKVREQDVGRAIRDEQGRVFYVLARSTGQGYYTAMTRAGSVKEEEAYDQLQPQAEAVDASVASAVVHDATGKRSRSARPLVIVILIIVLGCVAYLCYHYAVTGRWVPDSAPSSSVTPAAPKASGPASHIAPGLPGEGVSQPTGAP